MLKLIEKLYVEGRGDILVVETDESFVRGQIVSIENKKYVIRDVESTEPYKGLKGLVVKEIIDDDSVPRCLKMLTDYERYLNKAKKIAQDWVDIVAPANLACNIVFDSKEKLVRFQIKCGESGIYSNGLTASFPIDFLFNLVGFKEHALKAKEAYNNSRRQLLINKEALKPDLEKIREIDSRLRSQSYDNPEGSPHLPLTSYIGGYNL